jgi:moderate conductance mechanosensitive channel
MSLRFLLPACLVLACLPSELGGMATAWAQQATTPSALTVPELTPAEAQRALSVLQDPAQRARLIETLQTIAKAAGPVPAEAASAREAVSAAAPTAALKTEAGKPVAVALKPDSLAAQIGSRLTELPQRLGEDISTALRTMPDLYLL